MSSPRCLCVYTPARHRNHGLLTGHAALATDGMASATTKVAATARMDLRMSDYGHAVAIPSSFPPDALVGARATMCRPRTTRAKAARHATVVAGRPSTGWQRRLGWEIPEGSGRIVPVTLGPVTLLQPTSWCRCAPVGGGPGRSRMVVEVRAHGSQWCYADHVVGSLLRRAPDAGRPDRPVRPVVREPEEPARAGRRGSLRRPAAAATVTRTISGTRCRSPVEPDPRGRPSTSSTSG